MTFVDDDEVEKILGILPEVWFIILSAHEGLEDSEEDTSIGWYPSFLADAARLDTHQGIGSKSVERVEGLGSQCIAVG